jgi:hypothetical protein
MRRALVTTDETARHPFRASLPPHVCNATNPVPQKAARFFTAQDVKEFLLAYCACFVAVSVFLM